MKKQILGAMCVAAMMSSCHIYKAYDRPESIDASGIYRDPASATDTLVSDTANMGNLPWKEVFRDAKLQALIEEGLANNVDMQAAILRVEEAKVMLTAARLSYLPSINLAPQGTLSSFDKSKPTQTYQLPVAASWEIDLFGKLLNAKRGQQAAYLQSKVFPSGCTFSDYLWHSQYILFAADARPSGGNHYRNGCHLQRKRTCNGSHEDSRYDYRSWSCTDACCQSSGRGFSAGLETSGT